MKFFILICLLPCILLEAKTLNFHSGQKAHYNIEYNVEGDPRLESELVKSTLAFDLEILEGDSYPFRVALKISKAHCNGRNTKEKGMQLEYFITSPETVEQLDENVLETVTDDALRSFLGQLFQLEGGLIIPDRSYRLFSYFLLHDWEQPVSIETHSVQEGSVLLVRKITNGEIRGDWTGHSIARDHPYYEGRVDVEGTIVWNLNNPLIQQRKNTIHLIELHRDYDNGVQTTTSIRIKQKWKAS